MTALGLIRVICKKATVIDETEVALFFDVFAVIRSNGVERHASPPQADYEF